jgi:hypothetical protein
VTESLRCLANGLLDRLYSNFFGVFVCYNVIMTKDEIFKLASAKLNNGNLEEIEKTSKLIKDLGYFFWEPLRGGQQFIIGFDGGYLFGVSALTYEQLVEAYKDGKRSE